MWHTVMLQEPSLAIPQSYGHIVFMGMYGLRRFVCVMGACVCYGTGVVYVREG